MAQYKIVEVKKSYGTYYEVYKKKCFSGYNVLQIEHLLHKIE